MVELQIDNGATAQVKAWNRLRVQALLLSTQPHCSGSGLSSRSVPERTLDQWQQSSVPTVHRPVHGCAPAVQVPFWKAQVYTSLVLA